MNKKYIRRVRQAHRNQAQYKQGIGPIAIVIILAILIGGGYLFAQKAGYFPETTPSDIIQPAPDSTADWKTYRSEKYGFEFRYPPSSRVEKIYTAGVEKGVSVTFTKGEVTAYACERIPDNDTSVRTINGIEFLVQEGGKAYYTTHNEQCRVFTLQKEGGYISGEDVSPQPEPDRTFSEMLETVEFID